ncbi:MAG: hypothetical protein KAS32_02040 [Candidatus Peribacteraceae bacterium]|nr:hypothetical protein [Candidatus Peribacteraceae bacterium]
MKDTYIVNCPSCGTEIIAWDKHELCLMCGEFMYVEFDNNVANAITWEDHVDQVREELNHETL